MERNRKKPIAIEAIQFNGINRKEIEDFVGELKKHMIKLNKTIVKPDDSQKEKNVQ